MYVFNIFLFQGVYKKLMSHIVIKMKSTSSRRVHETLHDLGHTCPSISMCDSPIISFTFSLLLWNRDDILTELIIWFPFHLCALAVSVKCNTYFLSRMIYKNTVATHFELLVKQ